jgi:hypothetical protein
MLGTHLAPITLPAAPDPRARSLAPVRLLWGPSAARGRVEAAQGLAVWVYSLVTNLTVARPLNRESNYQRDSAPLRHGCPELHPMIMGRLSGARTPRAAPTSTRIAVCPRSR